MVEPGLFDRVILKYISAEVPPGTLRTGAGPVQTNTDAGEER
jgi:hypothetical protein